MKILNLYAGIGGNIELIDDIIHQITNIELTQEIADVLKKRKPKKQIELFNN